METIISSIISGFVALSVCMINNMAQKRAARVQHEETVSLIEYKLDALTKRVEQHNNLIDRTYKLEELTALQEEKIKVANHRIEDLEKERNCG